jgi:hypothetical protein
VEVRKPRSENRVKMGRGVRGCMEDDLGRNVKRDESLHKTCTYAASIKEAGTASLDELRFSL